MDKKQSLQRRKFLTAGGIGLGAAGLLATGCSQEPKTTAAQAPAVNTAKRELKLVTTWPKNFPGLGTSAQRFADRVTEMTDGRLTVKLFAAGELVGAFESFDAVSEGTADMYHGADYYWVGKNKAFAFFTAVPMGFTANEIDAWIHHAGAQELWDQLSGRFNIKPLACGNTGSQMGGWFNKEINSLDDMKGLKMRMPGLGGEVLNRIGASGIALPGGEIFPALQSGAIDATEWVGPWNDLAFGFYKITKYYYYPGFHEPGSALTAGINKDVWESLSKADQEIIKNAAQAENNSMYAEYNAKNTDSLNTLINEHNVQLRQFGDDVYQAFSDTSNEVLAEVAEVGSLESDIYNSFIDFRKKAMRWTKLSDQTYANRREAALG